MKQIKLILSVLAVFIGMTAAEAKKPLKVLAIGNSFSQDAVEQNLWEVADADGTTMIIGNLYIGGCSLERHWKNAQSGEAAYAYRKIDKKGVKTNHPGTSLAAALADEKWDIVSFQQRSPDSGDFSTYEPYLEDLIKFVKKHNGRKTRLMFHQTWAYENGATHSAFPKYGNSCWKMFDSIVVASSRACEKYGLGMIPAGTAIQSARMSEIRENVTRDGYHLNIIGRYIAALTWYEALTGRSVENNSYTAAHIEPWVREIALAAAHNANLTPGKPKKCGPEKYVTLNDEAGVPEYTLPDALTMADGSKVSTAEQWFGARRPELLKMFTETMFGKSPAPSKDMKFEVVDVNTGALKGIATRKQVNIILDKSGKHCLHVLIYLPNNVQGPVPVFMGINFNGNIAVSKDSGIIPPSKAELKKYGIAANIETGVKSNRWPLEQILAAGYGVVTFYRGDTDPDFFDGWRNGIVSLGFKKDQTWPEPDEWGTISQWAWSLSRVMDYAETDPDIDAKKVAVIGHSRLGKTALWAGAQDERFAIVISNCSGAGGAAISRRMFGEVLQDLNRHFPHWFCENFHAYSGREAELPFDQHELLALVAPRPLYVASADGDKWADPKGEFTSAKEASKVYEFLGKKGLAIDEWPAVNTPSIEGDVAYHMRQGKHDITPYDWENYIRFADKYFK